MTLTSTQEDYIEAVYRRLEAEEASEGVRVTDLADDLGCRMPTVTRTVRLLVEEGYFDQEPRGLIRLTRKGRNLAEEIVHRHDDVVAFLTLVLGLTEEEAQADACRIEHGLSPVTAQRFHAFLDYFEGLSPKERAKLRAEVRRGAKGQNEFSHLVETRSSGWRK